MVAGRLDPRNAPWVLELLRQAGTGCQQGWFDALVTAPVHKGIINDAGLLFLSDGRVVTIAAMTEGDEEASFALLYEVAAAVWAYYDR